MSCFVFGLVVWVFVVLLLCVFCLFCVGLLSSHGDSSMDYVSILLTLLVHIVDDVAIALIRKF